MQNLEKELTVKLQKIVDQGQHRHVTPLRHHADGCVEIEGKTYLNLAGNDYLGIATNQALHQEFFAGQTTENLLERFGMGSTASRLMTGNSTPYQELEERLRHLYKSEAALVFNSGYHLNIGILPAIAAKDDLILADKLCHASLIDGIRLSRSKVIRYPHLDYDGIERILEKERNNYKQLFIVTESIFSMDGDEADLARLVDIKNRWNGSLYVDDAHGVGIRGKTGCGLAEEYDLIQEIELLTGTCGKAYGAQGAFVICSQNIADYLLNTARSQIFTTGLPPINVHWLYFVLDKIPSMTAERAKVDTLSRQLRDELRSNGLTTFGTSSIVPVMIGEAARAVQVAEQTCRHGFWVKAVRPPTVPPNTSRLRLSLNASMEWEQLQPLPACIAKILL